METGLTGRRALVTAASLGLGRAVAAALLDEGCRVVISSSNRERIEAAARWLRTEGGPAAVSEAPQESRFVGSEASREVHAIPADLTDAEECESLVDQAVAALGGLDVLVVNTGGPSPAAFAEVDEARWRHAFDLVLMSAVRLSRAALPELRRSGHGAIVAVTSIAARAPIDRLLLSNALRPAVTGVMKTLSREAAPEVRVNCVAPNSILTDRLRELHQHYADQKGISLEQQFEQASAGIPLRRLGTPEELAATVVFLASDAAAYVNGVTLTVDGGADRGLY
jgi:3-oxoacyl-[acyl-carrier protein] reductase